MRNARFARRLSDERIVVKATGGEDGQIGMPRDRSGPWTIGFVAPLVHGFYYGSLLAGILDTAANRGGRVIAIQTHDAGVLVDTVEDGYLTMPLAWDHIDGFVVAQAGVTDDFLRQAVAAGKPVAGLCRTPSDFYPMVTPDNHGGVNAAVDHLIEHGHSRIAFVGRIPADVDDNARYLAYQQRMLAHGLQPSEPVRVSWRWEHRANAGHETAVRQLLERNPRPTALVACTDMAAFIIIEALGQAGVMVPHDMAVIGFDDLEDAATFEPPLSTVAQSFPLSGATACALVIDMLEGRPVKAGPHGVPVTFVPRESCGCLESRTEITVARPQLADSAAADLSDPDDRPAEYRYFEQQRRYYLIGTELLRRRNWASQSLAWLESTEARAGCLALWEEGNSHHDAPTLRVVGTYDAAGDYRSDREVYPVREFPPAAFVDLLSDQPGDLLYLQSVKFDGSDWGFLALVGPFDAQDEIAFQRYNHWAALLTVALDQEQAVRSERALLAEIRVREERYALAAEAANDGLWDWNLASGLVYYSARWKALLGHSAHEITATINEWLDRIHPDDRPSVDHMLVQHFNGYTQTTKIECRLRAADDTYRWMLTHCRSTRGDTGQVTRLVGSMTDITDRKLLEDRLRHGALYDVLTGLPNRTLFLDRLNQAIERARRRPDSSFAVVFLDLNRFKVINDSLGHEIGDKVLIHVAEQLSREMRTSDTCCRFGGDEFVLLLDHAGETAELLSIVNKILCAVSSPLVLDGRTLVVSASAGIAVSTSGPRTAEELIRDADTAMYRAKATGSGTSMLFDRSMHENAMARWQLESDLRQAVADKQFELYYQPVLNLKERRAVGLEALLRWKHPERGMVPPDEFLPVAESTGIISELGQWVIRETCRQIQAWRQSGSGYGEIPVSVNLSHRQFWDPELRSQVQKALSDFDVPACMLVFEVTEGVIMHSQDIAGQLMRQWREDSIKLHLDDFGTGYSSLSVLHTFPIDALKIDRSFVSRMKADKRSRDLIRLIIGIGLSMGVEVIAEGIETEEEASMLRRMGCPLVQGYLFSRPVPADLLPTLLAPSLTTGR